jgi:hypothetical protein
MKRSIPQTTPELTIINHHFAFVKLGDTHQDNVKLYYFAFDKYYDALQQTYVLCWEEWLFIDLYIMYIC